MPAQKAYLVKEGKTHYTREEGVLVAHGPGDPVMLTEAQFNVWKDKFEDPSAEAVRQDRQRARQAKADEAAAAAAGKPASTTGLAQDEKAKTPAHANPEKAEAPNLKKT